MRDRRNSSLALTSKPGLVTEFLASEGKPVPDINTGANVEGVGFGNLKIGVCGVDCLQCLTSRAAPLKQRCLNLLAIPSLNCWAMG